MTDKTEAQPEALRLAEFFESLTKSSHRWWDGAPVHEKAATVLRAQATEIEQLKAELSARQAAPDGWRIALERVADPRNTHFAGDAQIVARDALSAASPPPEREPKCWCETCRPITISDMRMVLCPDCGNKRCPKATHHDNACTNSNAPGQPGSSWEHVKPHGATND